MVNYLSALYFIAWREQYLFKRMWDRHKEVMEQNKQSIDSTTDKSALLRRWILD